jgi:hypothetical protein
MRTSAASHAVLGGLVAGLVSVFGCGSRTPLAVGPAGTGAAGSGGTMGSASGAAGAAGQSTAGASGTVGGGGSSGLAGSTAGTGVPAEITKVVPAGAGCGKAAPAGLTPGLLVRQTMQTMGVKDANCADSMCGAWSYVREYYIRLPTAYDNSKPYPLVLEGPGCGGHGNNLYYIPIFDSTVIRVGLSPSADAQRFHATNPSQGCFDDHEGDDSVDWVFYEDLYDQLAATLCFDRNRVFAAGNSTGASFSNELGCKYAGDATRPVRGIMANTGGLPTDPRYVPTCTSKPMAGMWVHELGDPTNPFLFTKVAIARAMKVNGCTIGTGYDDASFDLFPIGTSINGPPANATSCERIKGCPDLSPLVVCPLPGNAHASHDDVVIPGFSTFFNLFENPPLLTP